MNKYQATLFANESDIYTALHSNKAKMSPGALRKIGFDRGLIFSKKLNREELIEKLADLPFSYSQVEGIQKKLNINTNQELYSVKRIFNDQDVYDDFDIDELYDVLEVVKQNRPSMLGNEDIQHFGTVGMYTVTIEYTEFDFKRNKFQQRKLYGGEIRFIQHKNYVSVRYTYTKRIKEILKIIIKTYQEQTRKTIDVREIDLSDIRDTQLRNAFAVRMYDFEHLYSSSSQFIYAGLEKVRVSKIKTILDDEKASLEVDDDDEGDEFELDAKADDSENKTFIDNASYDGKSLVNTLQIEDLCKDGFYRSQIKWKAKATFLTGNPVITFELAFDDKYSAKDLKFKVVSKESAGMPDTKEKLTDAELDKVISHLEEHIFVVNDFISSEAEQRFSADIDTELDKQEAS